MLPFRRPPRHRPSRPLRTLATELDDLLADPSDSDVASHDSAIVVASRNVTAAEARLQELLADPDANELLREQTGLTAAQLSLEAARIRLDELRAGPDPTDVRLAQQAVRAAELSLADAQARLDELKAGPSQLEVLRAQNSLRRAELALDEVQVQPDALDVEEHELAVTDAERCLAAAQEDLTDALIVAPFTGVVLEVNGLAGLQAPSPVLTLAELASIRVVVNVDETDVGLVRIGQPVTLEFESLDGAAYSGTVISRGQQGEASQGLVTFPVEIGFTSPDQRLLSGLTADVSIVLDQSIDTLVIPRQAVQTVGNRSFVQVLAPYGAIQQQPITVGLQDNLFIEVLEGLAEGDAVVMSGAAVAGFKLPQLPAGFTPGQGGPGGFGQGLRGLGGGGGIARGGG